MFVFPLYSALTFVAEFNYTKQAMSAQMLIQEFLGSRGFS